MIEGEQTIANIYSDVGYLLISVTLGSMCFSLFNTIV